MNNLSNTILWAISAVLLVAFAFALFASSGDKTVPLTLDQLAQKINEGAVSKIVVQQSDLSIDLKDGTKATSKKEAETGIVETLSNYGVNKDALAKVSLDIQNESGVKFWLSIIIPSLLPLIFIAVLFMFLMRSASRGANQAFSFGKVNVRLF